MQSHAAEPTSGDERNGRLPRSMFTSIQSVEHIRRLRRGAQSHLLRCADGHLYVVKRHNNPQHKCVSVNEWLNTGLVQMVGLSVPTAVLVDVHAWLQRHTPDLSVELCGRRTMFTLGLAFGSRYVVSPTEGQVYDHLPETMTAQVRNLDDCAGMFVSNKWTCNADCRQVVVWKDPRKRKCTVSCVDKAIVVVPRIGRFPTR